MQYPLMWAEQKYSDFKWNIVRRLVDLDAEEIEVSLNQKGSDNIAIHYKTDKKVLMHAFTFLCVHIFVLLSQIYKRDVDHTHESVDMYPPRVIVEIDHSPDNHNIEWEVCLSGTKNKCCLALCSPRQLSSVTQCEFV